jgi:hypothetical protein
MDKPPTYEKTGHKRKLQRRKGIRHWNAVIEKVINDKKILQKFLATVKIDYSHKKAI